MDTPSSPLRVGIYPVPGFALLSYASTVEPLRAANLLAGRTLYDVVHFAGDGGVASSGAASVDAMYPVGAMPRLDLMFVIAGGEPETFRNAAALDWLARLARAGVPMGGVSGGPVILARAGLMSGRRMTVHWEHAAVLAEIAPDLILERRLYVIDRDRLTCGGGTAALDLMHRLLAERHGSAFARLVSDWFLHTEVRAAGDPQRAGLVERLGVASGPLIDAVAAMEDHIADPLTLGQLATIAGVSARQLNRLFRARLGTSPMGYYRTLRLDVARRLLTRSRLPLTEIAFATGFAGSAHFSRAYALRHGMPPSAVRKSARAGAGA